MLIDRIESAVRDRRLEEARKLLRLYLRQEKNRYPARTRAAEWLRRLGQFREAYLLMAPKLWNFSRANVDPELGESFLWAAYFLNLQGATEYAVQILEQIRPQTAAGYSRVATIQMSNGNGEAAIAAFTRYFEIIEGLGAPETYAQRMLRISFADAYAAAGKFPDAFAALARVRPEPGETFLQGILHQATGEYHARNGNFPVALSEMEKARALFPVGEQTVDAAFLEKWFGYALASVGRTAEAKRAFAIAEEILAKPDHSPEMRLDLYYWMQRSGLLEAETAESLSAYPGLSRAFLGRPGIPWAEWVGRSTAPLRVYPARDEWVYDGRARLGVPLEVSLLAWVRRAGMLGVSVERLKPLLWPGEVASYLQLDTRLAKLLQRLRSEYDISLPIEAGVIRAPLAVLRDVAVENPRGPVSWTFLDAHPEFEAQAFADYYGLGRTIAFKRLSEALESGRISKSTAGRRVLYRAV